MTNGDEGSAPMVIVLKYNADAIRQCSRKLVGGNERSELIDTGTPSEARQN